MQSPKNARFASVDLACWESFRDARLACSQTQCSLHTAVSRYESDMEQARISRRWVIDFLEANHFTSLSRALIMLNPFTRHSFCDIEYAQEIKA